MKEDEVKEIARRGLHENKRISGKIEETHISWVIITQRLAYKIKKPLALSFLDFSTLELRKKYCEMEVKLNSRFSAIYLGVEPIRYVDDRWVIGKGEGEILDYCVIMKRLSRSKKMDNQLRAPHKIKESMIKALAIEVAEFHNRAEKKFNSFDLEDSQKVFNDIDLIKKFSAEKIGIHFSEIIDQAILWSNQFLEAHAQRFQQRIDHGLKRDVHGDLHTGNIFLYKKPILFDCIEFNDQYRQIDVLYEIAFLCMDMEVSHQKKLSTVFLDEYKKHFLAFQTMEDNLLFIYFKSLRANVRAKVHAMAANQTTSSGELLRHTNATKKYLVIMNEYMASLHVLSLSI